MGSQINTEIFVGRDRYLEVIGFTSYVYITGRITKYSGMAGGRMRTLGEFIENFIYGKIAEEAFKLFLRTQLKLDTLTELDVADFYQGIYVPDIVALKKNCDFVPLNFWIDVKEVRRDQRWLLVPAPSIRQRPYDAYVAVWVGLPEDHVIWLVENVPEAKKKMSKDWIDKVSEVANNVNKIQCRIIGFALWNDVLDVVNSGEKLNAQQNIVKKFGEKGAFYFDGKTPLFDPENPSWRGAIVRENVGFSLRSLEKSSDWNIFASLIRKNRRIVPQVPLPRTKKGVLLKGSGLPPEFDSFDDYRDAFQRYLQEQLDQIGKRFGKIRRTTSWFSQPLK